MYIQKNPGILIGPLTRLLGYVFNFVFNLVHNFLSLENALGISIILITVIVRLLIWPFSFKQIKNSIAMQKLQPEIKKIQQKYSSEDRKNIEVQKKINTELQKLYADNKINPTGGCLLAFIQLPIFMALNQLLTNSYCYISSIDSIYKNIARKLMTVPNYISAIKPIATSMVPKGMIVDLSSISDLEKFINKFTNANWNNILSHFKSDIAQEIIVLLNQKKMIESSFGINLVEQCGFRFPGVIIPILSVITTFLSSYFMLKSNDVNDKETIMQQRIMLIFMPLMMGFISLSLSAGVGVYWIVNSVIQLIQQFFANKCRNDYGGKKISV